MDSTENLLSATLRSAAESAPPPSGVFLPVDTPNKSRWTSRRVAIATGATTMLVIGMAVGGAAIFGDRPPQTASRFSSGVSTKTDSPNSENRHEPPSLIGQRERVVTFGGAAFPLPNGWTLNDNACGEPHSNTVTTFSPGSGPRALCTLGRAPGVSEVQLWSIDDAQQRSNVRVATNPITLDDGTAGFIGHYASTSPAGYSTVVLAVPDRGVVLVGDGPRAGILEEAMLRLTDIPANRAVVPALGLDSLRSARVALDQLDLHLKVVPVRVGHGTGRIRWQLPAPGLAVLRGSTVTIAIDR